MFKHKYSLSDLSPASHFATATHSRESSVFSPAHIAQLADTDTLRVTLALSRKESYWRLLHSRDKVDPIREQCVSERPKLVIETGHLDDPFKTSMPPLSPSALLPTSSSTSLPRPRKIAPSERDYERMLNRLDKVIHGTAGGPRSMILTEEKPVAITLIAEEWQYLRVKTEGMKIPMLVTVSRTKGKVVCYLSKTQSEPTERSYDEVYWRDCVEFAEVGLKFKHKAVVLGFRCLEDADFSISLRFGVIPHKHKTLVRNRTLADLNELRKDETKRQALYDYVEALMSNREAERNAKFGSTNYILRNIEALTSSKQFTELQSKRETEQLRRELALKRRKVLLQEKKYKGLNILRKKQLRLEEEERSRKEQEGKQKLSQLQCEWLRLCSIHNSALTLWTLFSSKRSRKQEFAKQMKAAMVLQRCYRKVLLTVNPKRLVRERALEHLLLLRGLFGPEICDKARRMLFLAFRDHFKTHRIGVALDRYYWRSKIYTVSLIQQMWRRYREIKQSRVHKLSKLWDEVVKSLLEEAAKQTTKRVRRRVKELETALRTIDRNAIFAVHLRMCQKQYYKRIQAYITTLKAFRQGVKAFIFSKLQRGEAVFLCGAPDFRYQISLPDMRELVVSAGREQGLPL